MSQGRCLTFDPRETDDWSNPLKFINILLTQTPLIVMWQHRRLSFAAITKSSYQNCHRSIFHGKGQIKCALCTDFPEFIPLLLWSRFPANASPPSLAHRYTSKRQISLSVVSPRISTSAYACRNCQHCTVRSSWQSVTTQGIQLRIPSDWWHMETLTPSDVVVGSNRNDGTWHEFILTFRFLIMQILLVLTEL